MRSIIPLACLTFALAACSEIESSEPASALEESKPAAAVALDGEGLRLVDVNSGSTRLIPFGAPAADVTAAVTAAQGPAQDQGVNAECGAGPLAYVRWDGLTVWSQDDAFAGWALDRSGPTTMNGVGVGMTRADLEASGTVIEVRQTTLGDEFTAGALSGLLGEQGAVTHLWAGVSCNFR